MRKTRKAFTLSEIMVTLAVVAILASIMLPVINKTSPNKQKSLFKKAYYVAERMVYEIVNDEELYPSSSTSVGLDNVNKIEYLGQDFGSKDNEAKKKSKFCEIFAKKVNTSSDAVHCDASHSEFAEGPSFKTTDGVAWYMPYTDFKESPQVIKVDVNGDTPPNCTYSADCLNPDRFEIKVEKDGKMFVDGDKEKEYLTSNSLFKDVQKGYGSK